MTIWVDLLGARVHMLGDRYPTRVIEAGDGPPLLLLHGIGGHAEAYARNVVRLGGSARAMAIDFLWHGLSAKPPYVEGEDIPMYAAQILDLLDSEGIDRADIEGESLGGWVGLWLALHHADRVGRLILNTSAGVSFAPGVVPERTKEGREALATRSLQAISAPTPETIRKRLEWLFATPDRVTDELVELRMTLYSDPAIQASLRSVFQSAFGESTVARKTIPEAELAGVRAPTLVLWTDHNPGMGPDVGRRIAARIPDARFVCLDDAAHWPQWEQPEAHDALVTAFLRGETVGESVDPVAEPA
ncbi:MAG TPA: alpha/beta hydrolase [Candidatus Saccharimonadales bacterium]|nr:alpha/beta hydrolase [Candidatus Saccharimonadales bacterium]